MELSFETRKKILDTLTTETMDLLIIGGGITGAGLALQAGAQQLKTGLIEMQDFAAGTSSRSTKLVHGGLRYLKQFEVELVAVEGETVAGYVGSQSVLGWADMMNLAVAPSYRRLGIGEKLVNELICQLKDNKVTCLTLEVRVSNAPAIALYKKLGFSEVGRRPGYYHNPREDALILRKEWDV